MKKRMSCIRTSRESLESKINFEIIISRRVFKLTCLFRLNNAVFILFNSQKNGIKYYSFPYLDDLQIIPTCKTHS